MLPRARLSALAFVLLGACSSSPPPPPEPPAPPVATVAQNPPPPKTAAAPPPLAVAEDPAALAPPTMTNSLCNPKPPRPPPMRKGGDLIVESPPRAEERMAGGRLRNHVKGALSSGGQRIWIGPDVPPFVFITGGTRELFLLDESPEGYFAFYRDPYNAGSCTLRGSQNCSYGVAFFDCSGKQRWLFLLDPLLSRPDHLEVQDIRYDGGVLYFNEACQSYSRDAGGRCSALVAVDPTTQKALWRTPPLTSNNEFLVTGRYIITGYGFTDEPDALFIIRRSDGKIMQRVSIPSAHETLRLAPDGTLTANIYYQRTLRFRTEGFDGDKPRLVKIP